MTIYEQFSNFMTDFWSRINKLEERAISSELAIDISTTELHIIEKIGDYPCRRMSEIARAIGITLATLTVACDKLESKGLLRRLRDQKDKRVVNVSLTENGALAYEFHKKFHTDMLTSALSNLTDEETQILSRSLNKLQIFCETLDNSTT